MWPCLRTCGETEGTYSFFAVSRPVCGAERCARFAVERRALRYCQRHIVAFAAFRFFSSYVALDTSPLRALRARYLPTCRSWRGVASRPTYLPTGARCGPHLIDLRAVRFYDPCSTENRGERFSSSLANSFAHGAHTSRGQPSLASPMADSRQGGTVDLPTYLQPLGRTLARELPTYLRIPSV